MISFRDTVAVFAYVADRYTGASSPVAKSLPRINDLVLLSDRAASAKRHDPLNPYWLTWSTRICSPRWRAVSSPIGPTDFNNPWKPFPDRIPAI